jgi:cell division control protein 7
VDEDAVMDSESEDELQVVYGQDDTPRKGVSTPSIILTAAVGDYGEDEDEEEAVEQVRYVDLDEDEVMGYPAEEDDEDAVQVPSTRSRSRRRRVVVDEDEDMDGNWVDRDEEQDALAQEPEPGDYQVNLNDSPNSYGNEEAEEKEGEGAEEEERTPFDLDSAEELSTLQHKSPDEQDEILCEITDFTQAVPHLSGNYKLLDRLGTGTFSSVYKAIDLNYHRYDNSAWLGHHPPESSAHYQSQKKAEGRKAFVAIKRIYVTSGPERIKNELVIMELARGCRHVSQLVTAFRCEDQVAVVMPYHRNDDFRVRMSAFLDPLCVRS